MDTLYFVSTIVTGDGCNHTAQLKTHTIDWVELKLMISDSTTPPILPQKSKLIFTCAHLYHYTVVSVVITVNEHHHHHSSSFYYRRLVTNYFKRAIEAMNRSSHVMCKHKIFNCISNVSERVMMLQLTWHKWAHSWVPWRNDDFKNLIHTKFK